VTVIRDGKLVRARLPVPGLAQQALGRLILGRELEELASPSADAERQSPEAGAVALHATGLRSDNLRSVDIRLQPGEVVGITGPAGSGHDELPYLLAGALPGSGGTLAVGARTVDMRDPHAVRGAGLVLIPEHRLEEGLAAHLTALENLTLPRVSGRRRLTLGRRWQLAEFDRAVERLGLQPPKPNAAVATYSGGNQQKLLLAKWMAGNPAVLVAHEPTQAVDVGARAEIIRALRGAARAGAAVLVSSVEGADLARLCDRVLVLRDGVICAELRADISAEAIADATYK
jgi:ribose transport system ATP-binding protein